eukprot:g793.t1
MDLEQCRYKSLYGVKNIPKVLFNPAAMSDEAAEFTSCKIMIPRAYMTGNGNKSAVIHGSSLLNQNDHSQQLPLAMVIGSMIAKKRLATIEQKKSELGDEPIDPQIPTYSFAPS